MGLTQKLGTIPLAILTDASNNVGIGAAPSGSYKLEVTGTGRFTSIIYGSNGNLDPTAGTNAGTTLALNGNSVANNYSIGLGAIRNSAYDMWFQTGATNGGGYRWYIGTSEKMTMSSTGNVGIGTSSPQSTLHLDTASSNGCVVRMASTSTNGRVYAIGSNFTSGTGEFAIYDYTAGAERMRIFASGNVRFSSQVYNNSVASPRTLFIASDGELGGQVSVRASKINIESFNTNWLYDLRPIQFNYRKKDENNEYTKEFYNELFYGLIAEETELVNKELCNYNENKLIGIEYSKLVPVLVKAIQELNERLNKAGL
jgi:hypothetical protein